MINYSLVSSILFTYDEFVEFIEVIKEKSEVKFRPFYCRERVYFFTDEDKHIEKYVYDLIIEWIRNNCNIIAYEIELFSASKSQDFFNNFIQILIK